MNYFLVIYFCFYSNNLFNKLIYSFLVFVGGGSAGSTFFLLFIYFSIFASLCSSNKYLSSCSALETPLKTPILLEFFFSSSGSLWIIYTILSQLLSLIIFLLHLFKLNEFFLRLNFEMHVLKHIYQIFSMRILSQVLEDILILDNKLEITC